MAKRNHVPVILTVAAIGVGVGLGVWLMRERFKTVARSARRIADPLDVFGAEAPDHAFEGVANFPYMPEGWRPRRGARD